MEPSTPSTASSVRAMNHPARGAVEVIVSAAAGLPGRALPPAYFSSRSSAA